MLDNKCLQYIIQGVVCLFNCLMYYVLGYMKDDFNNLMIGVVNGYLIIMLCNLGLQKLVDVVVVVVKEVYVNLQIFGMFIIFDGMLMGIEGMKFLLILCEVIVDCIEICVNG